MEYQFFDEYVLRTPLLSMEAFLSLTKKKSLDDEDLISLCSDAVVMEAIYLASPSLHEEIEKWREGLITNPSYSGKIKLAFLRYLIRMSSRCTPFGLFSGVSVGTFGESTDIRLSAKEKNGRRTRLDMELLVSLSLQLAKDKAIRPQLLFYPNSSRYVVGDQLRYIEYSYQDGKRIHEISGAENTEYLQKTLKSASSGRKLDYLAKELVDDEISFEEASEYINEMVENQLLVSELEPSISGPEFLEQLEKVFEKLHNVDEWQGPLKKIATCLKELDDQMGNGKELYDRILSLLKIFQREKEPKYTFQADLAQSTANNTLDKKWLPKIRKALILLNKMTLANTDTPLQRFQKEFGKRYERREISLPKVMDVEMGIGFKKNRDYGDINPFVDDLKLPAKKREENQKRWSKLHELLQEKVIDCLQVNKYSLELEESDFKDFELSWDDLPDTLSGLVEICNIEEEDKLVVPGFGGASAVKLIGRFCHLDEEIHEFAKKIVSREKRMNPDEILAEIVHLPKDRIGNVLMRPSLREFEIPYLSTSELPKENQIGIEDLYISHDLKNRLRLRSKRLNKEVLPRLGNAHNFLNGQLPLYEFLTYFQAYDKRNWLGFKWGPLESMFSFLPRVEYQGVILSKARWQVKKEEMKPMLDCFYDKDKLAKLTAAFFGKRQIPQYVSLVEGDNTLLVNTYNATCIQMILNQIKNKNSIILEEFLHLGKGPVRSHEGHFSNQFVVSMYNAKKLGKR